MLNTFPVLHAPMVIDNVWTVLNCFIYDHFQYSIDGFYRYIFLHNLLKECIKVIALVVKFTYR